MVHEGHAYMIVSGQHSHTTAIDRASQMIYHGLTGHLAAITSSSEYNFLRWSMNAQDAWIALSGVASKGSWIFAAGPEQGSSATTASFLLWSPGEPSNPAEGECVVLSYGGYSTRNCSEQFNYIIEFECTAAMMPASRCNRKHACFNYRYEYP
jgi:hypothetical protein